MSADEKTLLREHGLKATPTRINVLRYLSSLSVPITAEELHSRLPGMNLSTVYRTLGSLTAVSLARKEVGRGKECLYSLDKGDVRHLLVCLRCGKKVPLEGCPYHEVHEEIEKETGFRLLDHSTEIYGICPACLRKEGAPKPCRCGHRH